MMLFIQRFWHWRRGKCRDFFLLGFCMWSPLFRERRCKFRYCNFLSSTFLVREINSTITHVFACLSHFSHLLAIISRSRFRVHPFLICSFSITWTYLFSGACSSVTSWGATLMYNYLSPMFSRFEGQISGKNIEIGVIGSDRIFKWVFIF